MNVCAIIAEYNPLHRGHAAQIHAIRRHLGESCAIMIALSGSFVQRGEPALLDKWTRTRMALAAGADLVLELPVLYATGSADWFAEGGIRLLAASGLHGTLAFGAETADLTCLQQLAALLEPETEPLQIILREGLGAGLSFAAARQHAVAAVSQDPNLAALLDQPNNILAVAYLMALRRFPAIPWQPLALPRSGQGDRDSFLPADPNTQYSATALRQALRRNTAQEILPLLAAQIPSAALAEMMLAIQASRGPVFIEQLTLPCLALLRSRTPAELGAFAGMGDGVAERLVRAARDFPRTLDDGAEEEPFAALMQAAVTRRHARTRVQRALIAALLGIRQADLEQARADGGPRYLRVLGFDRKGRHLLALMRRLARVPVITRASDFLEYATDPKLTRQAGLDLAAQDIWSTAAGARPGQDFDTPPVMR